LALTISEYMAAARSAPLLGQRNRYAFPPTTKARIAAMPTSGLCRVVDVDNPPFEKQMLTHQKANFSISN
jgi:hypothetical protein